MLATTVRIIRSTNIIDEAAINAEGGG